MLRLVAVLLLVVTACGRSKAPAPVTPQQQPVATEQEVCQRVAERVVDRFVVAAATRWKTEYPEVPAPSTQQALSADHRPMFVTVVFDSCLVEWPAKARSCFLASAVDAPIQSCQLGDAHLAGAIRRATTLLYSLSS